MKNRFLSEETADGIDKRIQRVLSDLGNPEPPLNLAEVLDVLELDKGYYSADDQGVLQETIHRLKVAGKQIVKRPLILLDAIKKFDLSALWLPDRKRILIDSAMPKLKQRWGEAHEIGHSVIPWHEPLMHGDQERTLSMTCKQQIEAEANYAAGRLLFLQDRFVDEVRSDDFCFRNIQRLHKVYGNTMTSTLWRTVESLAVPAFGMVSIHPKEKPQEGQERIRRFLRSRAFGEKFSSVTAGQLFNAIGHFCYGKRGPIGKGEILLEDENGVEHAFFVESSNNSYDTLTFGVYQE